MSKNLLNWVLVFFILIVGYQYFKSDEVTPVAPDETADKTTDKTTDEVTDVETDNKNKIKAQKRKEVTKQINSNTVIPPVETSQKEPMAITPPKKTSKRNNQPPKGMVEFAVTKSGYAIAFGDIVMGKVQPKFKKSTGLYKPKGNNLWPSNKIPYYIQEDVAQKNAVLEAIEYFNQNTAVEFVPYNGEANAIVFMGDEERCASFLGMGTGVQPIILADKCGFQEILHELMHALGFVHEHSRADRDNYVEVLWDNVKPGLELQFYIMPDSLVHEYVGSVFNFNYKSVMLYRKNTFSAEPSTKNTLKSTTDSSIEPVKDGLSPIDIERIGYLYGR